MLKSIESSKRKAAKGQHKGFCYSPTEESVAIGMFLETIVVNEAEHMTSASSL
ncbi:MAG: hypothetical protein HOY44_15625 [Maritimibacter sp.]|uniref:hypothetical protein n=1 Tax=Maritimibacter sp. TaxID=2003363 RepID=UPI001D707CFE|nr:hypothetical protein [Maritimibacter sp.]MBL6428955.1 hypothetical protein [Maritimibacter sp.]